MIRFSFTFLIVAISMLSSIFSNKRSPVAAAAAVECGKSNATVTERIVGGEKAKPHAWPWQALVICNNITHEFFCGGSLIAEKWVITAAHCVYSVKYGGINECDVYLGKHYSQTSKKEPKEVKIRSEKSFVHEKYSESVPFLGFDIALLKLSEAVQYDNYIKPICLPFGQPELKNTSVCYATGWGDDDRDKKIFAKTLKQLKMPVHDDYSYCRFHKYMYESELKICAGSWKNEDDVCDGDSGGPLACIESDGKWYLRGVTSFGPIQGCYSVATFTKVAAFGDWIAEKMSRN